MLLLHSQRKHAPCVLLIGTPNSGKKTVLNDIAQMKLPIDVLCLNDTPTRMYKNFVHDYNKVILVLDSTKIIDIKYLLEIDTMLADFPIKVKLLILVNKQDVVYYPDLTHVLEKFLQSLERITHLILPIAARNTNHGISEGISWLI